MKSFITAIFALVGFAVFADSTPNYNEFKTGTLTNVPSVLTASSTSNINAIIFTTPGHGIDLFPMFVGTNSTTSNIVMTVSFARDRSLTNWTTANNVSQTNALNGTTAVVGRMSLTAAQCDDTCAVRVNSLQSLDTAQATTVSGIAYSLRVAGAR